MLTVAPSAKLNSYRLLPGAGRLEAPQASTLAIVGLVEQRCALQVEHAHGFALVNDCMELLGEASCRKRELSVVGVDVELATLRACGPGPTASPHRSWRESRGRGAHEPGRGLQGPSR